MSSWTPQEAALPPFYIFASFFSSVTHTLFPVRAGTAQPRWTAANICALPSIKGISGKVNRFLLSDEKRDRWIFCPSIPCLFRFCSRQTLSALPALPRLCLFWFLRHCITSITSLSDKEIHTDIDTSPKSSDTQERRTQKTVLFINEVVK